MFRVSKWHCIT